MQSKLGAWIQVFAGKMFKTSPALAISPSSTAQGGGELVRPPPPGVSKLSVVELRKKRRITLDEYSRLVVRFFDSRSNFDPVMRGQMLSAIFFTLQVHISKLFTVSKRNFHQRAIRSILSRMTHCFGILITYLLCISSRKGTTPPSPGKGPGAN